MNILNIKWLQPILFSLSIIYTIIITIRNKFYDWHIFSSIKIKNCKIISVGNISVGGTGKTPAVEFLAHKYTKQNKKVVILSRGYLRTSKGTVVASDGKNLLTTHTECGDEPYLLAKKLPGIPIVVESDRVKGCNYIINNFKPDYIILDDAFQHRRIKRDIDIVLVDSTVGFGNTLTLPAGFLRDDFSALFRLSSACSNS